VPQGPKMHERLRALSVAVFLALSYSQSVPCTSTCLCNTGKAKNVPNIWPNATGMLCGHPPNTCEVCSFCNSAYPKCPCCGPLYAEAESCFICRLQGNNAEVCGNPQVTYSCDHERSECNPKAAGGGAYPTKSACVAACQPSYNCQNTGQGDKCIVAPKGTPGTYANESACYAKCKEPPGVTYTCAFPAFKCKQATGGIYNSSAACEKVCLQPTPSHPTPTLPTPTQPTPAPPTPSPKPTPTAPTPVPPTPAMYTCDDKTSECTVDPAGTFKTKVVCKAECTPAPKPTPAPAPGECTTCPKENPIDCCGCCTSCTAGSCKKPMGCYQSCGCIGASCGTCGAIPCPTPVMGSSAFAR
jgi:hypothetical protein